jgi:hypothetical protein
MMPGKNQRVRKTVVGFVVLLVLGVGAQAAVPQRLSPAAVGLLERFIPVSLRLWLPAQETAHRAHRRALPLKCGGTIDPNGGPCPPHAACAGCG